MIKTFTELGEVDEVVGNLYKKIPGLKETKFGYAYTKFYRKNYEVLLNELKEEYQTIAIDNALEDDKTKAILKDDKGDYLYSKEGKKKLLADQKKIIEEFESKEITITPYISSYVPEMDEEERSILTGLII